MSSNPLYEPFLEATKNVLTLMLDLNDVDTCPLADGCAHPEGLEVAIEIFGDVTGAVIYRFPGDTPLKIVGILSGMEFTAVDDFVVSAMGEVANIISGNVMTALSDRQLTCDIRPPKVLCGESTNESAYAIRHAERLTTAAGDIELSILLNRAG